MNTTSKPWNATGGIPLNVTLHGWPVPPPEPDLRTASGEADVVRNNGTRSPNFNATGYVAPESDIIELAELTDIQTLVLAALGTLSILVLSVGVLLGARVLWFRYRSTKDEAYEGVLARDESSETGRHLVSQLKTSESQFTAGSSEGMPSPNVVTPKSNGSVITMTLKNNHLIVETEETECVSPSARMESRGSTTTYITNSTPDYPSDGNAHGVLVHRHPEDNDDDELRSVQTGLSQSDLSMSSSGSQNTGYRYGNQTAYDSGGFGYSETNNEAPMRPASGFLREGEVAVRANRHGQMDRADSVVSASDVTMFLSSDVMARKVALERQRLAEEDSTDVAESSDSTSSPNPPISKSAINAPTLITS